MRNWIARQGDVLRNYSWFPWRASYLLQAPRIPSNLPDRMPTSIDTRCQPPPVDAQILSDMIWDENVPRDLLTYDNCGRTYSGKCPVVWNYQKCQFVYRQSNGYAVPRAPTRVPTTTTTTTTATTTTARAAAPPPRFINQIVQPRRRFYKAPSQPSIIAPGIGPDTNFLTIRTNRKTYTSGYRYREIPPKPLPLPVKSYRPSIVVDAGKGGSFQELVLNSTPMLARPPFKMPVQANNAGK